jgi:hypothetical protein
MSRNSPASRNPFAFIARAHLAARQTGDDMNRRYDLRLVLQDAVTDSGMDAQEVLWVTRFIEEVMRLPEDLHRKLFFEQQARKEKAMELGAALLENRLNGCKRIG